MSRDLRALIGALAVLLSCLLTANRAPAVQATTQPETPDTRSAEQMEIDGLIAEARRAYRAGEIAAATTAYASGRQKAETARDDRRIAACIFGLALISSDRGEKEKALDLHRQALEIRERVNDQQSVSSSLSAMGLIYMERDEAEKAKEYLQKAVDINRKLGNPLGIAESLNNLALYYYSSGQMEKALSCHEEALTLKEKSGGPQTIATTLNNMGILYQSLGQTEQALEYHRRALALKEKLGNPRSIALTLNNLGVLYADLNQTEQALDCHRKALAVREKLDNPADVAESLNNLGNVYIDLNQWDKALEYHKEALDIRKKLERPSDIAMSLTNLGYVAFKMRQPEKSLDYFHRALPLWEKRGAPQEVATILGNIGTVCRQIHRTEEALANYRRAIDLFEAASLQLEDPAQLGNYQMANVGNLYAAVAEILSRTQPEAALAMLERGRAQGLARQIAGTEAFARLLTPQDREQLQVRQTALGRAAAVLRERSRRLPPTGPEKRQAYDRAIGEAESAYQDAQLEFTRCRSTLCAEPRYAELRRLSGIQPLNPQELTALSRHNPETLYLEYAMIDEKSLLRATLRNGHTEISRLPCSFKLLADQVRDWRTEIMRADAYDRPKEEQLAYALYSTLLAGLTLDGAQQMIVVGEKGLLDVPFAALRDGQGRRLLDRCAVSSAFSLASLTWPAPTTGTGGSLLCMADPTGSGGETYRSALRGGFGPLPHAREEGNAVAALVPGARKLVGPEAKEAAVKAEMGRYDMLHFATHAVADGRNGLLSGLILAPEPLTSKEDGVLLAEEIAGMSLRARLAVLSACETARGQQSGGEGLLGLGWAFRAAGVPSVIASQWRVDDSATETLMVDLYRGLEAGQRKDAALRAAMLRVKRVKPNPFYWAAFQAIGDCKPLK